MMKSRQILQRLFCATAPIIGSIDSLVLRTSTTTPKVSTMTSTQQHQQHENNSAATTTGLFSTTVTDYESTTATTLVEDSSSTTTGTNTPVNSKLLGEFPRGPTIENKHEIFDDIDKALGVDKPPDIEVILTDHMTNLNNPVSKFLHLNVMRFGHIAIRYTTSDGEQHVMNIMGNFTDPDSTLINFFTPGDYFYGTDPKIAQQGGVYSRPFVGVRIENAAPGATDALHSYYKAVSKASEIGDGHTDADATPHAVSGAPGSAKRGAARFQLVEIQLSRVARYLPPPLDKFIFKAADWLREKDDQRRDSMLKMSNAVGKFVQEQDEKYADGMLKDMSDSVDENMKDIRGSIYQSGNCAQWTSGGLDFTGLMRRAHLFPKAILIDLFEDEYLNNKQPNNVNVVYYAEVEHAPVIYPGYKCIKPAMVHPLKWIRNNYYEDMKQFATAIVEVPKGSNRAQVTKSIPSKTPQKWLQYVDQATFYVPAAVMIGLVKHVGPIGPGAAAAWMGANWWLY